MSEDQLIAERKAKITEWERLGFSGYAKKFDRTHTAEQALTAVEKNKPRDTKTVMGDVQLTISMCGRIMNMRDMGKMAFIKLRDVSGDFQICLAQNVIGDHFKDLVKVLDMGDFAGFTGEFIVTKHGDPTLMAAEVTPLSKAIRPLPDKFHGLADQEVCYRERNLDLISNENTLERFKIRSAVVREIRQFYHDLDFIEIETSTLERGHGSNVLDPS